MLPSRDDTIAAIATAAGPGAIGIVRLSGGQAEALLRRCFERLPAKLVSHHLYHGWVREPLGSERLDEGLAVLMRAPHSYTGEDVVELQVHGGVLGLRRVLEAVFAAGARPAEPGEFTLRAFLAGRIDLSQAEAVAELIAAESDAALALARSQLAGALRNPIARLREQLVELLSLLEAALDFADEEHVYQLPRADCAARIDALDTELGRFARAREHDAAAIAARRVLIVGRPNSGKSSLFNRLVGAERAIVTPIAGTTRDLLEASTRIGPLSVVFGDTAGQAEHAADPIERIGIERSHEAMAAADLLLWVVALDDAPELALREPLLSPSRFAQQLAAAASTGRLVLVLSKADLVPKRTEAGLPPSVAQPGPLRAERPQGEPQSPQAAIDRSGGVRTFASPRAKSVRRERRSSVSIARELLPLAAAQLAQLAGAPGSQVPGEPAGPTVGCPIIPVSALSGVGLDELERSLAEALARPQRQHALTLGAHSAHRHAAALQRGHEALLRARDGLDEGLPLELACADVRDAADALAEILGSVSSDELLANIFGRFCVGK